MLPALRLIGGRGDGGDERLASSRCGSADTVELLQAQPRGAA